MGGQPTGLPRYEWRSASWGLVAAGFTLVFGISLYDAGFAPSFWWFRYWVIVLWLSWTMALVPWLLFRPHVTAPQLLGIVLVAVVFARFLYSIVLSFPGLFDPSTVAPTWSPESMWRTIWRRSLTNVLVPLMGVGAVAGPHLARLRELPDRLRALLDRAGAERKRGWGEQIYAGLALFLPVLLLYIWGFELVSQGFGESLDTGDDSQVFVLITPQLALALALMAGITEELLFRGILQRALRTTIGLHPAIFVQGVFFGFIHAGYATWLHVLGPMMLGWGLGYIAHRWGLLATILIHSGLDFVIFGAIASNSYPLMAWPVYVFLAECIALPIFHYRHRIKAFLWKPKKLRPPSTYKGF